MSVLGPSLGYPFAVGAATFVNPCGVALLPVYLSSLLGDPHRSVGTSSAAGTEPELEIGAETETGTGAQSKRAGRIGAPLVTAVAATAGFVALFTAVGVPVAAGASVVMTALPEVMLGVAGVLVVAGVSVATGRHLGLALPEVHGLWRRARHPVARGALFGVAYAIASLGCALPLFLAGVAGSLTRGGWVHGLAAFVAYGSGMGAMFAAVSVVTALGGAGIGRWLRRSSRWFSAGSGVVMVAAGGYLADYWGADLAGGRPVSFVASLEAFDSRLGSWLGGAALWIAVGCGAAVLVGLGLSVAARVARHRLVLRAEPARHARARRLFGWRARGLPGWRVSVAGVASLSLIGLGGVLGVHVLQSPGPPGPVPGVSSALAQMVALDALSSPTHVLPDFSLTDQHGQRVSLGAFRGDAVVLSFNDDRCQDLCPLFAADVRAADRDLGPAGRRHVVFLAVNANPYYPQVRYVRSWSDAHDMGNVRNWIFATGPVPTLERIWARYGETVLRDPATRTVKHSTVFYVIGPHGHERDIAEFDASSVRTRPWGYTLARLAEDTLPPREQTALSQPVFVDPIVNDRASRPRVAPAFSLARLGDPSQTVSLAGLRGRSVLLAFWASWCPDCRADLPVLNGVARRDRRLRVVGVAVDTAPGAAEQLARRDHLGFSLAVDSGGDVAARYGIDELPTTFLIGPSGHVVVELSGTLTAAEVHQILAETAAARSP